MWFALRPLFNAPMIGIPPGVLASFFNGVSLLSLEAHIYGMLEEPYLAVTKPFLSLEAPLTSLYGFLQSNHGGSKRIFLISSRHIISPELLFHVGAFPGWEERFL